MKIDTILTWVNPSDILPAKEVTVLVLTKEKIILMCVFTRSGKFYDVNDDANRIYKSDIRYWAYLPEFY